MNRKNTIPTPHDRFFKKAMSDLVVAKDFLHQHLPQSLLKQMNWETLHRQPESFIDMELKQSACDILYRVQCAHKPTYFYVLVEHQSVPDRLLPYRILKYTLRIIEKHLQNPTQPSNASKPLPLVIPIVFYTGQRKYTYSNDINHLVDSPEALIRKYFLKPFTLIDLQSIDNETLQEHIWAGLVAMVMKYPSLQDTIQQDQDFMRMAYSIDAVGGGDLLKSALEYILNTTDRAHPEQFVQRVVKAVNETTGAVIMTMAERLQAIGKEKWIQQGIAQGMEQGMERGMERGIVQGMERGVAQGTRDVAIELLKQGIAVEWVAQVTKLPVATIQDMKQAMEPVDG